MFRSCWELDTHVRHHIANLVSERQLCSQIDRAGDEPARRLLQFRQRLGIGLIQVGQALAGAEALAGLPSQPTRPAVRGHQGS
jgi:hypothetical protein